MNTHESYVSLETAKMLKKVGFDWECMKCYNHEVMFDMESDEIRKQCPQHSQWDILAPTLDVAQRWLREVKGYHISVFPETTYKEGIMYNFSIYKEDYDFNANHIYTGQTVKTYEEALEEGIKKCLTILLEEKE